MVRLNITVPDDVIKELQRVKNKSGFIAQTLREKFKIERKNALDQALIKAYKQSAKEDASLAKDWDATSSDRID